MADWYLPAFKAGGPVRSVAALVYHLKDKYNFFVITSNKDAFDEQPLPVKANEWVSGHQGEKIFYLSGPITKAQLLEVMNSVDYDSIYINSFFSKPFSIYPLLLQKQAKIKKPIVLAPRGMLRPGALAIKSSKKKIFITLAKLGGLHKHITWHATSLQEEAEIKKVFPKAHVILAGNLTLPPQHTRQSYTKNSGELKVCSVTRLVRNKKIDFAIQALKDLNQGQVSYNIFGPAEDEQYYKECLELTKSLPAGLTVTFHGNIEPNRVEQVLQEHHVFLLPTETENFGHAIVEAMLNGCIPVISDRTPWQDLEKNGIGWDIPLADKKRFTAVVRNCLGMNETAFKAQSIKIQQFAVEKTGNFNTLKAYEQLFK